MAETPREPDYPELFRQHIQRSAARVHADVQRAGTPLPEDVRQQTLHVLSYALDLPTIWPLTGDLLQTLAPQLEQAGLREDWMPFLEKGIAISDAQGDTGASAELRLQLSILLQAVGQYAEARQCLEAAAAGFAAAAQPRGQARALSRAAYIAHMQSRAAEGYPLVETAVALLNDDHPELGYCYLVLGMLAFDASDWDTAITHGHRAVTLCERHDQPRTTAFAFNNLSMAYRWSRRLAEAAVCGERAIQLFEEVGDPVNLGAALYTLGNVHIEQGDAEKALELYLRAEAIMRQYGEGRTRLTWQGIARALRMLGRYEAAESYYQRTIEALRSLDDRSGVVNALDGLGLTYHAMGRPDQARAAYVEALHELESLAGIAAHAGLVAMVQEHLDAL